MVSDPESALGRRRPPDADDYAYQVAGALLRSVRERCGLTQSEFAEVVQLTQSTLSAYETGRRQPTLPTLLGVLGEAGFELRLEVQPLDRHDEVLAEWEKTLEESERERLRQRGYRFVSDVA